MGAKEQSVLRILHFGKYYPPDVGGIEYATRQLAEYGVYLGYKVFCWVSQKRKWKRTITEQMDGVVVTRSFSLGTLFSAPLCTDFISKSVHIFDVVHIHLPNPIAELQLLLFLKKNKVLIPFFHAFPVSQGTLGKVWFKYITRRLLKRSSCILISNKKIAAPIAEMREFQNKIFELPFSIKTISTSDFKSLVQKRKDRKRLLSIGRLVKYKGHQLLLEAWKSVLEESPQFSEWILEIAGDGPEKEVLHEWSAKNLNPKNISWFGFFNEQEKDRLFRESSAFILSSISEAETFGIALLEAFAYGLPTIVSDLSGGVANLSRNGECGVVYKKDSKEDLVSALKKILAMSEEFEKIGANNLAFASKNFSKEEIQKKYQSIIESHRSHEE